ncbi:hypothetical protein HH310_31710 [Actinoplanes sp. TBRC 11911]|uniref:hypothetical protein n=1 Tax=Actinoplanes sp. TBRC 11911 TaxID=2729386 RepID=UPI00145EA43C|nr:hypothetical protein [Actinoplanes sp. TBRC 11911]NMO55737.1 hypothetical protein [Actinoplanes sp. TBRC 11911]
MVDTSRRLTIIGHLPLNHDLRGFYRTVIAIGGLLLAIWGVLWIVADGFGGDGASVGGLQANGTFGLLSVLMGLALVVAAVLGRNVDHWLGFLLAALAMALGVFGLTFIRTTPEPFALSVSTCVTLLTFGVVIMCAASYVGTGTSADARHRQRAIGHLTIAEYEAGH